MKFTKIALIAVIASLVCADRAQAGPDYQALKACLRNCIATTPPFTRARLLCVLDCYADYVDSKLSSNSLDNKFNPGSTGYVIDGGGSDFRDAYLDLTGAATATVSLDILPGQPTPLQVDYILVSDAFNPPDPVFGTFLGSSTDAGSGFAFSFAPVLDGIIVAQAHFTTSPTEDIDQAAAIYFTTQPLAVPEPSTLVLAGLGGAVGFGVARLRRRRARRSAGATV